MAEAASAGTRGECRKVSKASSGSICILTWGRLRYKRSNHGIRSSEINNSLREPAGGQKNPPAFFVVAASSESAKGLLVAGKRR